MCKIKEFRLNVPVILLYKYIEKGIVFMLPKDKDMFDGRVLQFYFFHLC